MLLKLHDQLDSFWPYQVEMARRVLSFHLPLWFPDYLGGLPFLYMDINWLFLPMLVGGLFRDPWAFVAVTMMQFILAGYGGYLFLQYYLKTDDQASFAGGLLWALGTFSLTYWRIFDLATIPLLFYCLERFVFEEQRGRRLLSFLGLLVAAANIYLAKGAPFIAVFQLFFIFFATPDRNRRQKLLVAFSWLWSFVVVMNLPVIISLFSSTSIGSRGLVKWIPDQPIALIERLKGLFNYTIGASAMNFGVISTFIFLFGLLRFKKWDKLIRALLYFYLVVLFFAFFVDSAAWFQNLRQHLPLKDYRLSRFLLPSPFITLLIIIANFEAFMVLIQEHFRKYSLLIASSVFLLLYYYFNKPGYDRHIGLFILITFTLLFLVGINLLKLFRIKRAWLVGFVVLLIFAERLTNVALLRVLDGPSYKTFFRSPLFEKYRSAHKYDYRIAFINRTERLNWHPTVGFYNGYQVAGGYASQYSRRYAVYWESVIKDKRDEFLSYPYKAYLIDSTNKHGPIDQISFRPDLLALHNVRYVFSLYRISDPGRRGMKMINKGDDFAALAERSKIKWYLKTLFQPMDYYVYEINSWSPRFFLANNYALVSGEKEIVDYIDKHSEAQLKRQVVYDRRDLSPQQIEALSQLRGSGGTLAITDYSDNRIVIDVNSSGRQQLILAENFAPDWLASVNGRLTEIMPAYGAFRAVMVDKGRNLVILKYQPKMLIHSFWLSGIGTLCFIISGFIWSFRRSKRK
ncbi:MAG: YfhO family protein [Candidatus Margulisiibacteriota bacterium]